ncbi:hypothetical protein FACS1894132_05880 [Clostridia bacterium]|nr:hypothetical protein FACS1894132_05880 [Clostridia bacterium]
MTQMQMAVGIFLETDIELHQSANAVYEAAVALHEKNYNVYSIGLFHKFKNAPSSMQTQLSLLRQVAKDIASSSENYYEVDDIDNLKVIFGDVADDIVNPNIPDKADNDPIIFIPGVMGTRLFAHNFSDQVWPPLGTWNGSDQLGDYILRDDLSLRPSDIDQRTLQPHKKGLSMSTFDYREYGAQDAYKEIIDALCANFDGKDGRSDRQIYFFSYDWRQSNEISASDLSTFINQIAAISPSDKVDLVCHSMGGIVASVYFENNGDAKLDKIITGGTPYEGSVDILKSIFTDDVISGWLGKLLVNPL